MVLRNLMRRVVGDPNERDVRRLRETVEEISALEPQFKALSDDELRAKTLEFKRRLAENEELDDILPEAYAAVREASSRATGLRHFDEQMIGGIVLHQGKIAEMKTGEGKTLVATLPLYLNALPAKGRTSRHAERLPEQGRLADDGAGLSHARPERGRDPERRRRSVTRIVLVRSDLQLPTMNAIRTCARFRAAKPITPILPTARTTNSASIICATTWCAAPKKWCSAAMYFAIVDEVDNILIDEARTPLIISGTADQVRAIITASFARIVKKLVPSSEDSIEAEEPDGDYVEDLKTKSVYLTDAGVEKVEHGAQNAEHVARRRPVSPRQFGHDPVPG